MLGGPPAVRHHGDPAVAGADMPHAGRSLKSVVNKTREPPARGRHAHCREHHSGKPHVPGEAEASVSLRRRVEPRQRLSDQRAFGRLAQLRLTRRTSLRRFLGELAKGEGAPAVDDEAVARFALAGAHVPPVGGCSNQHVARYGRSLTQRLFECAHRRRVRGNSSIFWPAFLFRQRIAVSARQRCGFNGDRLPSGTELVRDDLWKGGPDSLTRLDLRHCDRDPPVACDLDEIAEGLLSPLHRKIAGEVPRPKCKRDDQAHARAAADQQCPAVELQLPYCALSARRSILPVPRRGSGSSEKTKRSGTLNLAIRVSRKVRNSSAVRPALAWITATGTSPSRSSDAPNTLASATAGQA